MTSSPPTLSVDPVFRIQVLFENEPGSPTREFKIGDLAEPSFDALRSHVLSMSLPNQDKNEYNTCFKYNLEERHESRWVVFENTAGLGYAIQDNKDKGYVFISACIVKKGAAAPPRPTIRDAVASSSSKKASTKTKAAKKAKPTKAKAPARSNRGGDGKVSTEQLILAALKEQLEIGISSPARLQICACSGYSNLQSKGYVAAMKSLKTSGYIEYPNKDTVRLTEAGAAQAPSDGARATTNKQIHERLKNMLKDKAPEVFDILSDGRPHEREQVASAIGYSCLQSKGFVLAMKQMKALNMITYPKDDGKKKLVQLTDLAFPFGRPSDGGPEPVVSGGSPSVVSDS